MNSLNFSGGPGILPDTVLAETQQAIAMVPEIGLSVLGISHRSDWFASVVDEAERNIRKVLKLPENYAVMFLQGGASLQFSMVPMLLLRGNVRTAEYLRTGYWSGKAIPEARIEGDVRVLWDGEAEQFRRLPNMSELPCSTDAAYLHYVSNETVEGTQFHYVPGIDGVRRVCDMSSDFLSRPFDVNRYDLIYAHAQKNLGPAGVTVVILRRDLLDEVPTGLPALLDYRSHLNARSIYNTPPVFAIYVVMLVTRWLLNEIGGLENMSLINQQKANQLYKAIDDSAGFYRGRAALENRSLMNVVFGLESARLEADFLKQAADEGFSGLEGHRSLGGIRASIYNAMTPRAVDSLCAFMKHFANTVAA
ncbi:MAG TPA: phosphoserine transaminase [Rhodocyclaceae bacterium]|nr:phosphoserine transaminase [Rhodocyclaceae bacterium]